jgi:hypothetical protein
VLKNKSDLKVKIKTLLTDLKIVNLYVRFIRCDNAGKNMTIKNDPEVKSFGITLKVERQFQTLFGRIRAMLNRADLEDEMRDKI